MRISRLEWHVAPAPTLYQLRHPPYIRHNDDGSQLRTCRRERNKDYPAVGIILLIMAEHPGMS